MSVLRGFYAAWMRVAKAMGRFNTRMLLTLFFYLIISPISLLVRMLSGNRLEMGFREDKKTFWIKRSPHKPERNSYERQF